MRRPVVRRLAAVAAAALLAACPAAEQAPSNGPTDPPLEAVDVGGAADSELSTEDDIRDPRRDPSFRGVMPGDFPADLPIYQQSSLVDYGDTEDGGRYVELRAQSPAADVEVSLGGELAQQGWQQQGQVWVKEGRQARITITGETRGLCLIRIEY